MSLDKPFELKIKLRNSIMWHPSMRIIKSLLFYTDNKDEAIKMFKNEWHYSLTSDGFYYDIL